MPPVSIKDIAAQTGVSFQTVSKVLKGKGQVSAETRTAILETAQRLGYIPNALARGLVSQHTSTIGVIVEEMGEYALQFLVGLEREARRHQHGVMMSIIDQYTSDCSSSLRLLMERRIDGLVLAAPHQLERNTQVGTILQGQLPVVGIHAVPGIKRFLVGSEQIQTGWLATEHLLQLGHRRIGTILGIMSREVTQCRLLGYQQALAAADIAFAPDLIEVGNWQGEGGYEATLRLLERAPDVTAIFAHNDLMAMGVLHALHEKGLRVPRDCSVVGCDDIPAAAQVTPSLTTIHLPFPEWGESAMRLLLEVMADPQRTSQYISLPVHLVQRESSGKSTRRSSATLH